MSRIIIITPPPPPPSSGSTVYAETLSRNAEAVSVVEGETALRLVQSAIADGSRIRIVDTRE